jgi:hypothetical protein
MNAVFVTQLSPKNIQENDKNETFWKKPKSSYFCETISKINFHLLNITSGAYSVKHLPVDLV